MTESQKCPGRFRCHGPASWCWHCGEVDLHCDDPDCNVHLRLQEKVQQLEVLNVKVRVAEDDLNTFSQLRDEVQRSIRRHLAGAAVMIPRGTKA